MGRKEVGTIEREYTSVAVLANISVWLSFRSPRKLMICAIKHKFPGSQYPKNIVFNFENRSTAGGPGLRDAAPAVRFHGALGGSRNAHDSAFRKEHAIVPTT